MCGIWLLLSKNEFKEDYFKSFNNIKSRGPDYFNFKSINTNANNSIQSLNIGFHRLSIMDTSLNGSQPFEINNNDKSIYSICNGEIYNYKELIDKYGLKCESLSDCEVIPKLYEKIGFDKMIKELRGEYALCIIDFKSEEEFEIYLGRDQTGVRPLYYGINENFICFSSILKGIPDLDNTFCEQFKPASYSLIDTKYNLFENIIKSQDLNFICYWDITLYNKLNNNYFDENFVLDKIRSIFEESVKIRLNSDRPIGALLSGGLDSSIVCAIASKFLKEKGQRLKTFSIGLEESTDKYYAELVSKFIDSDHTHYELSSQEFVDVLPTIVKEIETYDTTTVRASTGQYLISKIISEREDIKVLLIGDGSDELCSGYMYFHNSPNEIESHKENIRLVKDIHRYDSQRADRGISSNGLEARVPFLDKEFIDFYLQINPLLRIPRKYNDKITEKFLLRKAFVGYLPKEVLWRPKEAFSDGVSSLKRSWFSIIQELAELKYSDEEFLLRSSKINHCRPHSKESLMYREYFNKEFSKNVENVIPYYWLPKWSGNVYEPSARVLDVYKSKLFEDNTSVWSSFN